MKYLGDFRPGDTIDFCWDTNDAAGASISRTVAGTISVYKGNSATQSTAGITDTENFDSLTGVHHLRIVLSDAFYEAGYDYSVVLSGAQIDGQSVNAVLGTFSISNRSEVNITLGAIQVATNPANRVSSPTALEMFQNEKKTFVLTIQDANGDPVDLSSMTLRFVAHDSANPPAGQFAIEDASIAVSGANNEIASVPVTPTESANPTENEWYWELWDVTTGSAEAVLAHGPFKIKPGVKTV